MTNQPDTCFIVVSEHELNEKTKAALNNAVKALGYDIPPAFIVSTDSEQLLDAIFEIDPWAVVAVDDASIYTLKAAFGNEAEKLAQDSPVEVCGYNIVAVPGFEDCLNSYEAKCVAWTRLQAAVHPKL